MSASSASSNVSTLIDGKLGREGEYLDGDCFLTEYSSGNYHFVELELDGSYYVTAVAIMNRRGAYLGNDYLSVLFNFLFVF